MEFNRDEIENLIVCVKNERDMLDWSVLSRLAPTNPASVVKAKHISDLIKLEDKLSREMDRMDKLSGKK